MKQDLNPSDAIPRRRFLRLAGGAAAASALGVIPGCAPSTEEVTVVEVPASSIPDGGRLRILLGEMPVELTRTGGEVYARSLWCSHTGCEVRWQEDRQIYFCPCHEGAFDGDGEPIAGPPPRPLQEIAVENRGEVVIVGSVS